MEYQSGIGKLVNDANYMREQYGLRTGQVASPVSPISDAKAFDEYIQHCLKNWTVDVVLDDGSYLYACRIITPQGNTREGLRRMFKFPKQPLSERHWVGDRVVVGFLEGATNAPVVLGALFPISITADPTATLAQAASEVFVTTDQDTWADRHEVIDYTDSANPLPAHTERRNSGKTVEEVQLVFEAPVAGSAPDNTRNLIREFSDSAKTLTKEHSVESGAAAHRTTNTVYESDTAAKDLLKTHSTQTQDGNAFKADVTYNDAEARIISLQHQVQVLSDTVNKLVLQSENAQKLTLSHDTAYQLVTLLSDSEKGNLSVTKTDKTDNSNASFQIGDKSVVVLRRASNGSPDAWVMLDDSGNIVLQSATGSTIRLSHGRATLKSGGSSVIVDDVGGVRVLTKDGGTLSIKGEAASISATTVSLQAENVTMATGALRIGNGSGSSNHLPSAEKLYSKLNNLENRLFTLELWAGAHVHLGNGQPPLTKAPVGAVGDFAISEVPKDSLQTVKGD